MGMRVEVVKAVRAPVPPGFLRAALAAAVSVPEIGARLPEGEAEMAIRITGDRELRRLNAHFAHEDQATDVLSFEGEGPHLGDVALSWPAAARQASESGHPAESEAALLCVHGLLHLLGWDHATPAEDREMARLTRAALAAGGIDVARGRLSS